MEEQNTTVDATHTIICYENGKTWVCPECEQGTGTEMEKRHHLCTSCNTLLSDEKANEREPVEHRRDENGTPIDLENGDEGEGDGDADGSTQTTFQDQSDPEFMDPLNF